MLAVPTEDEVRLANAIVYRLWEKQKVLAKCDRKQFKVCAQREVLEAILEFNRDASKSE